MTAPRSINSISPFISTAREYIDKGWGILPLPSRQKEYPPTGFTGRAGKFADEDKISEWLSNPKFSKGNIALRLGKVVVIKGIRYEVIGIDVDAYGKKLGDKNLLKLEKLYGELPPTWTSSARTDGISGIRFYLVPHGYGFKGEAGKNIDIVQRVHRYAVCYPSWHPDTKSQYFWYAPTYMPDGESFSSKIPDVTQLTVLPEKWLMYLTAGGVSDGEGDYGIDLDISNEDLLIWLKEHLLPGDKCSKMEKTVKHHTELIIDASSHHDKIKNAHWNIICEAVEGHAGWQDAIDEIESVWRKDVLSQGKRTLGAVKREISNSRWGAYRKIKAKSDSYDERKEDFFSGEMCMSATELSDSQMPRTGAESPANERTRAGWIEGFSIDFTADPKDYEKNDVGQAQHFLSRVSDNVRYLADYNAWLLYDGKRWHLDDFSLVRSIFHKACVETSKKRAMTLYKKLEDHLKNAGSLKDQKGAELASNAKKLLWVAEHYGNDHKIKAALSCFKSLPGVCMLYKELNSNMTLLATPSGKIIKLLEGNGNANSKAKGFSVVNNKKEYYVTQTTACNLLKKIDQKEVALWKGYLDLFLPNIEYRQFVQKVLGYVLIGGNPEKKAIFLVGIRDTGKTTMIKAMQECLGDYAATFQPNSVFRDSATTNPELGNLLHKRGIFSSESGSQRIYANPLKRNTGGDKISITRKYANSQIIGVPHFVPIVATNQPPTIEDADEALIKRIIVLPFKKQVSDIKNDPRADVIIPRDAKHAVLQWLVFGYQRYIREGLGFEMWHPEAQAATKEFAAELNDIAAFLNETCLCIGEIEKQRLSRMPDGKDDLALLKEWNRVQVSVLYRAYCSELGSHQKTPSQRIFGKKVREFFGVEQGAAWIDSRSIRVYIGLKWRNEQVMNQIKA